MSKVNMTISKQASKQASKISIIIPAYNCETTIERCILGITKGTYNNIEVIVVDNGSEDSTKEIANTDPIPYEQPLNVIPAATERNNFSVAESMKLSVGSFHLTIPNGTDPQLLAQTLRIVKELEC